MSTHRLTGATLALGAAALWGTTGTAQHVGGLQASPLWVGALRVLVAAVVFAGVVGVRGQWASVTGLPWRSAWPWVLGGGLAMATYNLCFFAGVQVTGVATGTGVALGSGPVWAGLLQWLTTRQRPPRLWWLGTALAVGGMGLMLMGTGNPMALSAGGVALCLAAGLAYASYTLVISRLLTITTPVVVTLLLFATAAAFAVPVAAAASPAFSADTRAWTTVLYLGVVATGLAYVLFSHALRHVPMPTAVTLSLAEPVVAFVLAVWLVGEHPTWPAYVGLGGVLAGLLLVVWGEARRR